MESWKTTAVWPLLPRGVTGDPPFGVANFSHTPVWWWWWSGYQDKNEDGDEGDGDDSAYHLQVVKPKGSFLVITKAELPSKNVQCVPEH